MQAFRERIRTEALIRWFTDTATTIPSFGAW